MIVSACPAGRGSYACSAEAFSASNTFWKGTAEVLLHQKTFETQCTTPSTSPERPPVCAWATAAQRQTQSPQKWSTGGPTEDVGLFRLSDYKPAGQVLAGAPTTPDECQLLTKRPPRPKVEVSDSLKLLLQASAGQQKPPEVSCTPARQNTALLGSVAARAPGQILLQKRSHCTAIVAPLPTAAESTQPAAALSAPQNQQGTLPAAAAGMKHPAAHPGVSLVPALLKRPKLMTHNKQPASKAPATLAKAAPGKGSAAGKATAPRKAPAGPKAVNGAAAKAVTSLPGQGSTAAGSAAGQFNVGSNAPAAPTCLDACDTTAAAAVSSAAGVPASAAVSAAPVRAPRQRKKADDIDLGEVEKKIQQKFAAARLQDLSIPELKCFLKARKLPVGGRKSDLIARVEPLLAK